MKKIYLYILSILFFSTCFSQTYKSLNCYTIAVGKNASDNGKVLIGHNEDDWDDLVVNIYKVPAKNYKSGETVTLLNGTKIPQVNHTYGYIWFETTTETFGDYYLNENGVSIFSNACASKEDTATGNIRFYLRRIIAERAKSAREGVKIAGQLITSIGYNSSGRTYCIADANEIWLFAAVQGHHWLAKRVPDDKVAIVPNYYTIETVNLHDTANVLASRNIIQYAILRGWYFPQRDKVFNFKKTYNQTSSLYSIGNIPRHWSGINALSTTTYSYGVDLPFDFTPKQPVTTSDIKSILSSHYEQTDFETHYAFHKNPHQNMTNRICNAGTKFSLIVELNSENNDENTIWFAPLNPCIHPYIPIVYNITNIPDAYQNRPLYQSLKFHFDKKSNTFEANPFSAYNIFHLYNETINKEYKMSIETVTIWKEKFESEATKSYLKSSNKSELSEKLLKNLYDSEKQFNSIRKSFEKK